MLNILKMPHYIELTGLSDTELTKRIWMALDQVDQADMQHESTTEKTAIYQAYKNELARRDYKHRVR